MNYTPEQHPVLDTQSVFARQLTPEYWADGRLVRVKPLPERLFIAGSIKPEDARPVAIIGARQATETGRQFAYSLAKELAQQGRTVISGLALGSDTSALKGAQDGGGRSVAVLPSGLSNILPAANRGLAERICDNGALVTEYDDEEVFRHRFIDRNRLIVAMAAQLVIIEGAKGSGTHQTAQLAYKNAVPAVVYHNKANLTATAYMQGAAEYLNDNLLTPAYTLDQALMSLYI